jgi:mannose-6-phosphate isomerase-like protein (cupin superfamily)
MTDRGAERRERAAWVRPVRRIDKPWGHEEVFALVDGKFCGKTLHIKAGHALSLQYHERKDETIAVQAGAVTLHVGLPGRPMQTLHLKPGESVHIPPRVHHRLCADTDAVVLEASTTELDDVVRLDDRYGRTPADVAVSA